MNTHKRYSMVNGRVIEDHMVVWSLDGGKTKLITSYQTKEINEPDMLQLNDRTTITKRLY
jgi:hypothetical protein